MPVPVAGQKMEAPSSRASQRISVNWAEDDDASSHGARQAARLEFEVAECIETKTVTTTTTTKRSFPPLYVHRNRPLRTLDSKEYPLAARPTPHELSSFTMQFPGLDSDRWLFDEAKVDYTAGRDPGAGLCRNSSELLDFESHPSNSTFSTDYSNPASPTTHPCRPAKSVERLASPSNALAIAKPSSAVRALSHRVGPRKPAGPFQPSSRVSQRRANETHVNVNDLKYPHTPDASDKVPRFFAPRPILDHDGPDAGPSQIASSSLYPAAASPAGSDSCTDGDVTTPTVMDDAELESFPGRDQSPQPHSMRQANRGVSTAAVSEQDASLPSPRLSPTLAATQLHTNEAGSGEEDYDDDDDEHDDCALTHGQTDASKLQRRTSRRSLVRVANDLAADDRSSSSAGLEIMRLGDDGTVDETGPPRLSDVRWMIETFDFMPAEMQTFIMYQMLRRCSRKTLRVVADTVNPALQCDFLKQLPIELSLHVLSFLDHRDLCRAAQVSKHWRNIVDSNETGWKDLFDRRGFQLAPGELQKAITQGWGWQDPHGPDGYERDLSLQNRLTLSEAELHRSSYRASPSDPSSVVKVRVPKRKRGLIHVLNAERSKRRAVSQEASRDDGLSPSSSFLARSEGPLSAANAAALAVPDPQEGLPSLRKLHLFKTLYHRHHIIQEGWTNGKVKPAHVAFTAHPRNVITCLQFDDDKIVTGSDDMLINVFETKTGRLRKKLEGHEGGVWALQYEGNTLVSGSTDRSVRVWDIEKGLCTQVFYGHTSTVRCLFILMPTLTGKTSSLDGRPVMMPQKSLIITGSRDSQLRVWRLPEPGARRYIQTGPPANDAECPYFVRTLTGHTHSVRAIAAHGDILVSGSYDSTVRVWCISTGEALHTLQGHTQKVYSVVLDHARNRCISGSMDSLVKIWDLDTGACLFTLEGHSLLVGILDLRDERLVSAAADSTLRVWDPETGRCRSQLTAHTGPITCFQHDGRKVISGSEKTVKMWDIQSGQCIKDLLTDLNGVWQVKFDERRCVAAVQRENLTYIEILDFGAARDGVPAEELGKRRLLNEAEVERLLAEA